MATSCTDSLLNNWQLVAIVYRSPIVLQTPNPVPVSRTPWAGERLSGWLGERPTRRLGECWDFSCHQQYPSLVDGSKLSLAQIIAENPEAYLGSDKPCQLLVKLLCAARPLSLQLHPDLVADGKHESWLVLATTTNSGGYFGFAKPFTREQLRQKIVDSKLTTADLTFQPMDTYDYFDLPPTTVHSLSADTIVIEVNYVKANSSGRTLRLWDWQHRYDDEGNLDYQHGKSRRLDVEQALQLFTPQQQYGDQFLATVNQRPTIDNSPALTISRYPPSPFYRLSLYDYRQSTTISSEARYAVYVNLRGTCHLGGQLLTNYTVAFLPAFLLRQGIDLQVQTAGQGIVIEVLP